MLRQSEISNFLDLIKHITQAKNFNTNYNSLKVNKKHRYSNETDQDNNRQQIITKNSSKHLSQTSNEQLKRKQTYQQLKRKQTQYQHKMLKISHDIKHRTKIFKLASFSQEKTPTFIEIQNNQAINKIRSNLYQNYCQMIQKKRHQKIKKMFQDTQPESNRSICNISVIARFDDSVNKRNSAIFKKSRSLKPGLESIRLKNNDKQKYDSKMPSQLNIQPMKTVKMPKLQPALSNKRKEFKAQKYLNPFSAPRAKKIAINKFSNIQGWQQLEQDKYLVDYF